MSENDILRFTTVGSVDDGKSTLIGRLLLDTNSIFEDQLAAVERTSGKKGFNGIDLALVTDGLAAEREQGITIDVAYRYFSTPKRKFIIADTPGHEQYTRNMVTGASTADLTIILVDARKGVLAQSRRHAFISSLLGIKNFIVAVNKMDLVDYSQKVFDEVVEEFEDFFSEIDKQFHGGISEDKTIHYVPISALKGHNVAANSWEISWYQGPSVLEILETIEVQSDLIDKSFRFPVQYVIREDSDQCKDFRGFAGQIVSGVIKRGDEVVSLPSQRVSKVKSISCFGGDIECAYAPLSVSLVLEDEIDTSRGNLLVKVNSEPVISTEFSAYVCWMSGEPLQTRKKYLLKHTTNKVKAMPIHIDYKINTDNLQHEIIRELNLNEIAKINFKTLKPLIFDPYAQNRYTGSFILIDEISNNTVGAGMITERAI